MAGIPIVEVVSGGIAATDTPDGAPVSVGTSGLPVRWVTSGGIPLNRGGTPPPSYDPDAEALFARMAVQPNDTRKGLINTLIVSLKSGSVWTKLDFLYVFAAHDAQAARLNWRQNLYNSSLVNGPAFTVDRGYAGDGSSSYLNANFNPATAGGVYAQNSAHLGVWSRTDTNAAHFDIGARQSSTTQQSVFLARISGLFSARINLDTPGLDSASGSSIGHFTASRTSSTDLANYINGSSASTGSNASAALFSANMFVGAANTAGSPSGLSPRQYAVAHGGSGLTAGEVSSLYNAINTYLVAIGAA
ncbi:hypothetical protein [Microcystis phage Mwe-JY13]